MRTTLYSFPPPSVPPGARVYSIPKSFRALAVASILFFGFCFVMVLLLPIYQPGKAEGATMAFCLPVFGGFVALSFWLLRACRARIASGAEGIWCLVSDKPLVFLRWSEISRIEEHPFKQRLVVASSGDENAQRKINLEYQLENFDELLAVVLEKTRNRQDAFPNRTQFHASRWLFVFLIGSPLFCAWLAYLSFVQHADVRQEKSRPTRHRE